MSTYRITIERIDTVEYVSKEWKCRWSDDVFKTDIKPAMLKEGKEPDEISQYGYAETDTSKEEKTLLYQQTLNQDGLPLLDIIKAVNGSANTPRSA